MYILRLKHHFCAAHQLKNPYSKECTHLHGHNWKVRIQIRVQELKDGMVVDFKWIKEIVNQLDHQFLNDLVVFEPTAENLAKYLHEQIQAQLTLSEDRRIFLIKITIWEADGASITYEN